MDWGKACFRALMTLSMTISPMLTASLETTIPPLTLRLQRHGARLADDRSGERFAQLRQVGTKRDTLSVAGCLKVLLHGGD